MIYTSDKIKEMNALKNKKRETVKKICIPFMIIFLLMIIYIAYSKFVTKENNIGFFGFKAYVILTGSMEPNYNVGDLIIVNETEEKNIQIGDVITFIAGEESKTISHRVIDIVEKNGEKYYQTKGDNNDSPDAELVRYSQIQGKLTNKISNWSGMISKLTTGTGIVIVAIVIIFFHILANKKENRIIERQEARKKYNQPKYKKEIRV